MFSEDVSCTMVTPENTMVTLNYEFVSNDMDFHINEGEVWETWLDINNPDSNQTLNIF